MTPESTVPTIEQASKNHNRFVRAIGSFVAAGALFGAAYGLNQEIRRESTLPPQTDLPNVQLTPEQLSVPLGIAEGAAIVSGAALTISGIGKLVSKNH